MVAEHAVHHRTAEWLIGAGRITGLLGGYTIALVVPLMARVPALERRVGSDRVTRWHAMSGRYAIGLIVTHVVLTVWGYAVQAGTGLVEQTVTVVVDFPDMIKATIGTGSPAGHRLRLGRARTPPDAVRDLVLPAPAHLCRGVSDLLAPAGDGCRVRGEPDRPHRLVRAVRQRPARCCSGTGPRSPVRLNLWHRMRVESTVDEAPGVVSVLITGRRLHRLGAEAGQFFRWRFLTKGLRWSANPYSLSARPART